MNAKVRIPAKVRRRSTGRLEDDERRLDVARRRLQGYPHELFTLARLVTRIQKRQVDLGNSILKPHRLNYVEYTALMALYGSEAQALTASELSDVTGEKSANITRLCDELVSKGLIDRDRGMDRQAQRAGAAHGIG